MGVPHVPTALAERAYKVPNLAPDVRGGCENRMQEWFSEFVRTTGGVAEEYHNIKRHVAVRDLTASMYDTFVPEETRAVRTFEQAFEQDKAEACRLVCVAWSDAMREGREETFLSENNFPIPMVLQAKRRRIQGGTLYRPDGEAPALTSAI